MIRSAAVLMAHKVAFSDKAQPSGVEPGEPDHLDRVAAAKQKALGGTHYEPAIGNASKLTYSMKGIINRRK